MIEAETFIERAREYGYGFYAGVPCSFLTPFINYVIDDERLSYVSAANEGDALAMAAGVALSGRRAAVMMQNSGLGNAVSPLTSLTWVFRLPVLLIVTWRGAPEVSDEPQHELMGEITPRLLDTLDIAWAEFPVTGEGVAEVLARAETHQRETGRCFALLMRKDAVAEHALATRQPPGQSRGATTYRPMPRPGRDTQCPSRHEALARIVGATAVDSTVVIATTGYTGRELYALADRPNHLYMVGAMGCAPLVASGLALSRPDLRVVAVDGDGAALMRLSAFATLGAYSGNNLVHLLLDNGQHESTGGQATVSGGLSFAAIAAACGYQSIHEGHTLDVVDRALAGSHAGPAFARLWTAPGTPPLPRPETAPPAMRERLMEHIGAA